jgi:hypothetical protein
LPDELAAEVMRADDLVRHFEEHPDPLVRESALQLLQHVDRLHRFGLQRLADLLRVAGLERRALEDAEVRLLYALYDLHEASADHPSNNFVPLSRLLGQQQSHA